MGEVLPGKGRVGDGTGDKGLYDMCGCGRLAEGQPCLGERVIVSMGKGGRNRGKRS